MHVRHTSRFLAAAGLAAALTTSHLSLADDLAPVRHVLAQEKPILTLVGLGVAIVIAGMLVGRVSPQKRRHLLRPGLYYALYILTLCVAAAIHVSGDQGVSGVVFSFASLFAHLGVIEVAAATVFFVLLARSRFSVPNIAREIVVAVAYLGAAMLLLHRLGVQLTSLMAASGVITLVVSLSLQNTLGNIVGGIALQFDGSIEEGQWIRMPDGSEGRVRQVRWRHTVVETRNWDTLVVPNSQLLNQNILVLGKREEQPVQHRMWVYFQIDFRYAPERVIDVVLQALAAPIDNVARHPPPNCICYDLAATDRHGLGYYAVRYWLTDLAVDDPTSSAVRGRIFAGLARAGIPLGVPPQQVAVSRADDEAMLRHREEENARRAVELAKLPLFATLTAAERLKVAGKLRYAPFCAGEVITRQGAEAHYLYILLEGTAEIRLHRGEEGAEIHVASATAPTVFGEMGMLTGAKRSATVLATSHVECFRLDKADFQDIIHARPEVAVELSKVLAKRKIELDAARNHEGPRPSVEEEHHAMLTAVKHFFGLDDAKD